MKTRGWALSAALMVGLLAVSGQAFASQASSTAGDILKPMSAEARMELQQNRGKQMAIVQDLASTFSGGNGEFANQLNAVIVESTEGTFLPQVNAVVTGATDAQRQSAGYAMLNVLFGSDMIERRTRDLVRLPRRATAEEALTMFNTATGYASTAGVNSGIDTARFNSSLIHNRQEELRQEMRSDSYDACGVGTVDFANRIWASPFHQNISQKDKDDLTGYKYKMSGFGLGYDHVFGPLSVGAAFIYSRGDYEWRDTNDDNKIDNYGGSVYMQYSHGSGFFGGIDAGFNHGRNDWDREISYFRTNETGKNHTNTYWVGGKLGYDFTTCSNFSLTPTVGLYWYDARSSAYNTRASGDTSGLSFMNYDKMKKKELILPVEVTAAYTHEINDCSSLSVKATGGYTYNFKKTGGEGSTSVCDSAARWNTRGMESARHGWKAGAGLNYNYKRFDVGVDYMYEGAKKLSAHSVSANLGVRF